MIYISYTQSSFFRRSSLFYLLSTQNITFTARWRGMTTPLTEAAAEMDVHCLISLHSVFFFKFNLILLLLLFTHPEWKWFYWVIQRISSVLSAKCRRNWNKQKTMVDRGVIGHESEGVEEQSHMVWMGKEFAGESLSELHTTFLH